MFRRSRIQNSIATSKPNMHECSQEPSQSCSDYPMLSRSEQNSLYSNIHGSASEQCCHTISKNDKYFLESGSDYENDETTTVSCADAFRKATQTNISGNDAIYCKNKQSKPSSMIALPVLAASVAFSHGTEMTDNVRSIDGPLKLPFRNSAVRETMNDVLRLNIGGKLFDIFKSSISKYPDTKLSKLVATNRKSASVNELGSPLFADKINLSQPTLLQTSSQNDAQHDTKLSKRVAVKPKSTSMDELGPLLPAGDVNLSESTILQTVPLNDAQFQIFDAFDAIENRYYFNRSGSLFKIIAEFYQTGNIHIRTNVCVHSAKEELHFWGILPGYLHSKCQSCTKRIAIDSYHCHVNTSSRHSSGNHGSTVLDNRSCSDLPCDANTTNPATAKQLENVSAMLMGNHVKKSPKTDGTVKDRLRPMLEGSGASFSTLAFQIFNILLIMVNVILIIVDSVPHLAWSTSSFDVSHYEAEEYCSNTTLIATLPQEDINCPDYLYINIVRAVDWTCLIWFTLEILLRAWVSQKIKAFLIDPMTAIDLLAIMPSYIDIAFLFASNESYRLEATKILRIFRIFRVFRVMKIARYDSSFRILGETLKKSTPEFSLLTVYLFVSTVLFGSLMYYSEQNHPETPYGTIPDAIWWSIVTYFGYADAPPVTLTGKIAAACGAVWGIIIMAIPISIIVEKFSEQFRQYRQSTSRIKRVIKPRFVRKSYKNYVLRMIKRRR